MKVGPQILSKWILCLIAGLLVQRIRTVSAVYSMNQTCAQIPKGFIADTSDCQSFGYCKNGILVGTRKCDKGYIYNTRKAVCDYPSSDSCALSSAANVCKYAPDKSFVADPNSCQKYYYCNNKAAQPVMCPKGQVYDNKRTRCVWSADQSTKCSANSICRLIPDGVFCGDPDYCGKFYICSGGIGIQGACPGNTFFNPGNGMCQANNPCQGPVSSNVGKGVAVQLPNNPGFCKGKKATKPTYFSDGETCMGFYICDSDSGPGTWGKCPINTHFSNGICTTPYNVPCPYDRCGNLKQEFVGSVGTQCHNYLICRNQTSQGLASGYANYEGIPCKNNEYFNEYKQKCETTSPGSANYKLCPTIKT